MADIQLSNQIPNVFVEGAFHAPNGYIHAGQMELEKFPDNAALKSAAEALGFARSNGESINKLRANPHEDHMPQQHDRAIRESCDSFERSFNEKFDNAKAGLVRELAAVEAGIAEKAGLKPNMAIANLTVGTLQSLKSDGERMKAVTDLLEDGDHETLATLMAVPRFTTMLPRDF
ncbi:MAG: hypothetical protein KYX64_09530, partial [Sphingopyxis sp.]|nr:hypothetical protein [Sphingopyxis sp.]